MFLELLPRELKMMHKNDVIQLYEITTAAGLLISEPSDAAHSLSRHGPATAWLTLERPGNVIPVPNTFRVLGMRS